MCQLLSPSHPNTMCNFYITHFLCAYLWLWISVTWLPFTVLPSWLHTCKELPPQFSLFLPTLCYFLLLLTLPIHSQSSATLCYFLQLNHLKNVQLQRLPSFTNFCCCKWESKKYRQARKCYCTKYIMMLTSQEPLVPLSSSSCTSSYTTSCTISFFL